ncbi:MAG TPA: Hsp20/alpha crystallin family protein [Verrucomicrobiae bacterium]|nr:Hsp20/alpha crystallin family protein [Verrucomicrobiae bacterium]
MNNLSTVDRGNQLLGWDPLRGLLGNWSAMNGVEIARNESGYEIEIAAPGFTPESIDVTIEDSVLTVRGKTEKRSFTRSFSLPDDIDGDAVSAKLENGLLTIALTLHPKAQPKRVAVTGSAS